VLARFLSEGNFNLEDLAIAWKSFPKGDRPLLIAFLLGIRLIQGEVGMVLNEVIGRRLLNVREAAQYLGLEVDTVYKKSRLREVPCVKVGRALRFDMKALERYIEQHTIETID
jgi:excisionase family DNA binding protein